MTVYRYVSYDTGDDGNNGTTELLAWKTFEPAAVSTSDWTVYVKASAGYTYTNLGVDTAGNLLGLNGGDTGSYHAVSWVGYTSTPGDGGVVTIDCEGQCGAFRYDWYSTQLGGTVTIIEVKNFKVVDSTSGAVEIGVPTLTAEYYLSFEQESPVPYHIENVEGDGCGFELREGHAYTLTECYAHDCVDGFNIHFTEIMDAVGRGFAALYRCRAESCSGYGFRGDWDVTGDGTGVVAIACSAVSCGTGFSSVIRANPAAIVDLATFASSTRTVRFCNGDTVTVSGDGVKLTQWDTDDVTVTVTIRNVSDDSLVATLLSTTADFTADTFQTFAALNGASPLTWTASAEGNYYVRCVVSHDSTGDVTTEQQFEVRDTNACAISVQAGSSAVDSYYLPSDTVTLAGTITFEETATGATVTVAIYDDTDTLKATLVNGVSVDFTAGVGKTLATIHGSAVTWSPSSEDEYYALVTVAHGSLASNATGRAQFSVSASNHATLSVQAGATKDATYLPSATVTASGSVTLRLAATSTTSTLTVRRAATDAVVATLMNSVAATFTAGETKTLATINGSAPTWTPSESGEFYFRLDVAHSDLPATATAVSQFSVVASNVATIDVETQLSAAREESFLPSDTVTVSGTISLSQAATSAAVVVTVRNQSDDSLVETLLSTSANWTAGESKTLATLNGSALTWTPSAGDYFIRVAVTHTDLAVNPSNFEQQFSVAALCSVEIDLETQLSSAREETFELGDTVQIVGTIYTTPRALATVAVLVEARNQSDDSLDTTILNTTADFTAGQSKTLATIKGSAVTWTPSALGDFYIQVTVTHTDVGLSPVVSTQQLHVIGAASPTAPEIEVTTVSTSSFTVMIITSSTDADGDLSYTRIRYRAYGGEGAGTWTVGTFSATTVGTSLTISGLTSSTAYLLYAYSVDSEGNESVPGTALVTTTLTADGGPTGEVSTMLHKVPGSLVWAPSDLSAVYPYGGTKLGFCQTGIDVIPGLEHAVLRSREDTKGLPFDVVYLGAFPRIRAFLQEWTTATLQRAFPGGLTTAGSASRKPRAPGTLLAGDSLYASAGVLMFAPSDPTNNPYEFLLARKAIPILAQPAAIHHGEDDPRSLEVIFILIPDTSFGTAATQAYDWGALADLSLT